MKNLIPFILLLLGLSGTAQVMHLKAVQFICTRFENQPMEPPEFQDLKGMPVEFDMDSSILYIHSPNIQVFHLDAKPFAGSNDDSILVYKFHGIDNKGVKCIITQELYESVKAPHLASFWLEYPDKTYMYYLEKG
jgi:hypothetical protein